MTIKVRPKMDFSPSSSEAVRDLLAGRRSVRAVLFDLDGTLYRQGRLRSLMALELLTLPLEGPGTPWQRLRALKAYRTAQEQLRGRSRLASAHEQRELAAAASGLSVADVDALVSEWMIRRPLKYLPLCRASGLETLLARLEQGGLKVGILSDYPAEAKLQAMGLADRFSPVLYTADPEIGALKPNPRGYFRACKLWNLKPRRRALRRRPRRGRCGRRGGGRNAVRDHRRPEGPDAGALRRAALTRKADSCL